MVPSFSKESAQILVSTQNPALEAGHLDLSLTQLTTQLCKAGETGKPAFWASILAAAIVASRFPSGPPLGRATVGTACDCCAVWGDLGFCGRNAELDLDLYSVVSISSCLPVLGGMRSQQNHSSSSDITDWGEEITRSGPQTWCVPT